MTFSWMAWTWPTAAFFGGILLILAGMTAWELAAPSRARAGLAGFATTRGDRLFVSLLGAAFINLAWLAAVGAPLWGAVAISALWTLAVFRWF